MMDASKYSVGYYPVDTKYDKWVAKKQIEKPPVWCSVDMRDGNQSLVVPMNMEEKLEFYKMLIEVGFKEIEVGFPASNETEYEFLRTIIDNNMIPDDVSVQVLTQCREHIIRKTFEACKGAPSAIIHFYNSTSVAQREQVFAFKGWYTDPRTKQKRVTEITMTENLTVYALWEQTSNTVNVIGKDRIYMTDEEIEMRKEILKKQYPPTFSNNQITKLIQLLQELLKQTEVQPQPTPQSTQTATTYIEGFGYVPQGNAPQITIGNSTGDINKTVANME